MKCMTRNKSSFYYALYKGEKAVTDEYGNLTGEYVVEYENPIEDSANISAAKGEMQDKQFGEDEHYDKVLVMSRDCPISEHSVLWVDTSPTLNPDGSTDTPYDYIVKKIAKSLNVTSVAISKVKVK